MPRNTGRKGDKDNTRNMEPGANCRRIVRQGNHTKQLDAVFVRLKVFGRRMARSIRQ